jgi:hypothetical protein
MNRQEQFGAFIEAAQKQGETNTAAQTLSDLIARILSKSGLTKEKKGTVPVGKATSPLPYAGKPKRRQRQSS